MVKCVSILGSTGSIGRQSLDVIENLKEIQVAALTAGTNVQLMAQQCHQFHPQLAVMATEQAAGELKEALAGEPTRISGSLGETAGNCAVADPAPIPSSRSGRGTPSSRTKTVESSSS